jgi:hypothetical protein
MRRAPAGQGGAPLHFHPDLTYEGNTGDIMQPDHRHAAPTFATPVLNLLKQAGEAPGQGRTADAPEDREKREDARPALLCKACRTHITRPEHAMCVAGSHRHVFFNPYGHVFELGCFASASNILPAGARSGEFTWFAGYSWQAVACAGCGALLGWHYTGPGPDFFGLILAALVAADDGPR